MSLRSSRSQVEAPLDSEYSNKQNDNDRAQKLVARESDVIVPACEGDEEFVGSLFGRRWHRAFSARRSP